ncbi:hypothetical protein VHA_000930 [Grimontia hollisae CIP 101886]|uniref:Uncharacterized protein n=1 Tax=Grimontia hollisae CIP 101886 TaxID=675812 RepID=D0I5B3_GRIHO|nr:hypothetical protein VHA_000930 [Grimontia hollisae CIP 101886]
MNQVKVMRAVKVLQKLGTKKTGYTIAVYPTLKNRHPGESP